MFRIFLTSLFALAIAVPCHAQGKPNTLTPKEIADGWILLFDGETTFGWRRTSVQQKYQVTEGEMQIGAGGPSGKDNVYFPIEFKMFELNFEYKANDVSYMGIRDVPGNQGQSTPLNKTNAWTHISMRLDGGKVHFDGPGLGLKGPWERAGVIWFLTVGDLRVRNIKLKPLNTTSLFNGKDLTGWNVFPGKKSKFAVIDNAINVKDGPGDLQTAGKYKDFVLQLEAISNGKNLNSGIFFRCRDGEYQNGYEAQIHNGFGDATKKYLLEEYDAKTNKLIGKNEALYHALDFGTGAIYRRVPARKQMSKDGEWFGMTVVAHGNHFATWVNGIQVTDWTDNRPKSDNARTGCKLEPGHLSIQGHDPTTDLSFRNFRIAEFK